MRRPKIFILEDAADVRMIIQATLTEAELTHAATLAEAERLVAHQVFDLYLLDIGLPDGESFSLCTQIRRDPVAANRPILFLSGRAGEVDKLKAFNQGADDYITKPFSALELKARVNSKLRNLQNQASAKSYSFPPLQIDLERRRASLINGETVSPIKLTKIEFNLLVALCSRPEVVKTRQMLLDEVWGDNVSVTERSVDVHIYNLRKKLGPCANMIEANHGNGYAFLPNPVAAKAS